MSMYKARQNKEKVSKSIDGSGMARQRVRMRDGRNGKIMQMKLYIDSEQPYQFNEGDPEAIQYLVDTDKEWHFKTRESAINVGNMVLAMSSTESSQTKTYEQRAVNLGIFDLFNYLKTVDDAAHGKSQDGRKREQEALITAIKFKQKGLRSRIWESKESVDYIYTDSSENVVYGFDPFGIPIDHTGKENLEAITSEWLNDTYDKHVRTKILGVSSNPKYFYAGLLDVSGLDVEGIRTVVNKIYDFEKDKEDVPHLSLVNSLLLENNVADYFPQNIEESSPLDFSDMFQNL